MEQSGIKEILKALELHSDHITKKMDQMKGQLEKRMDNLETRMDERFDETNKRFNNQETKVDSLRVELTETQETVDFLSGKNVQHEKKLRKIYQS